MSDVASASLSIGIMIIEYLILLLAWSGFLQLKRNRVLTYIAIVTFLTVASFVTNIFITDAYIKLTIHFIITFAVTRCFYKNKWYVLFFCSSLGIVYLKAIDSIVLFLSSHFLRVAPQAILDNLYPFILLAFLSKSVEFIGAWCFSKAFNTRWQKDSVHWQSWVQTLPLPVAACFFLSAALQLCFAQPDTAPLLVLLAFAFLCLCVLQLFIAHRLDHQRQSEEENQRLQQTLALRKESLQSLTEAYKLQRHLTHEFNNHLNIITSLAEQEKLQELRNYLGNLHEREQSSALVVHTGNAVMDAVLNQKYRIAMQHHIAIDFDMTNLANIFLRNDELAVVISNLLDNAIEACIDYEGARIIRLKTKIYDNQLVLMVTNPTKKEPHKIEGKWVTSKSDSLIHGFGLSNVENILDSFKSEYTSEFANGIFSFVAFIPL
ncbi:MAG: GHKL domain-containing protein [Oscillospiraceae bacterium]